MAKIHARESLVDIRTHVGPSRPVVFHAFSGNGVNMMAHVLHASETDTASDAPVQLRQRVRGMVFDSAPMQEVSGALLSRALTHVVMTRFAKPAKSASVRTQSLQTQPTLSSDDKARIERGAYCLCTGGVLFFVVRACVC